MSPKQKGLTVADLMSRQVVSIARETNLQDTIGLMVEHGIRHVPVLEGEHVVAVLSDRDVRLMLTGGGDVADRRRYLAATAAMVHASRPVTTIGPDAPAGEAARIFVESRIGCLPVVDSEERIVGILTQTDLLQWIAREAEL